jgi:ATP-binding cassette subfamily C protein
MKLVLDRLRALLPYLPAGARRFLVVHAAVSSLLALVDVAALGLLAVVVSVMARGGQGQVPLIGTIRETDYPWVVVTLVALILLKSTANVVLQWIATRRFAHFELEIGDQLFAAYMQAPWLDRLKRTTSELVRLSDVGIANTIAGFLLPVMMLPSLVVTFLALIAVLVLAQPVTALVTLLYLGGIGALLYFWVSRKSIQAGRVNRDYSLRVAALMTEMVGALKEITLRDKFGEVAAVIRDNRRRSTRARANINFLGALPRFVIDSALVGGFLLVGGVSYVVSGADGAINAVALFAVAGFRMVPSLTGFQGVVTTATSNAAHVSAVLADIEMAKTYTTRAEELGRQTLPARVESISLDHVTFTYPDRSTPAVRDVSLSIRLGTSVALVGASGSGKSTLVDLMLGLIVPQQGTIFVGEAPLPEVLGAWRRRVGYVPQDVAIFDGTIAQNVALSWGEDIDMDKVRDALARAQLLDAVLERPGGLDSKVGERGLALSGGQRQRLGIARALFADPLVLVMDEATSALDTKTESDVTAALRALRGEVTLVAVAHRLATIRHADQVCFMSEGRVVATGSFDDLVRDVPEFAVQASLAGLA